LDAHLAADFVPCAEGEQWENFLRKAGRTTIYFIGTVNINATHCVADQKKPSKNPSIKNRLVIVCYQVAQTYPGIETKLFAV
jgi:hypothetical protein